MYSESEVEKMRFIMGTCSQMGMLHPSQTPPHNGKRSTGQGFHSIPVTKDLFTQGLAYQSS